MLLYLDTLKKTCFRKKRKKERKRDVTSFLTSYDCDVVFGLLLYFRDGDGRDGGFVFQDCVPTHTSTCTVSHCCWARSCYCMDHPVAIVCKQCGEGRRDDADSEKRLRKKVHIYIYVFIYMYVYICTYAYIYMKEYFLI